MSWVQVKSNEAYSGVSLVLAAMIFVSAISVVYVTNKSRKLFSEYYKLQLVEQELQDERARLLLQESSESTMVKVFNNASIKLKMYIPAIDKRLYLP